MQGVWLREVPGGSTNERERRTGKWNGLRDVHGSRRGRRFSSGADLSCSSSFCLLSLSRSLFRHRLLPLLIFDPLFGLLFCLLHRSARFKCVAAVIGRSIGVRVRLIGLLFEMWLWQPTLRMRHGIATDSYPSGRQNRLQARRKALHFLQ